MSASASAAELQPPDPGGSRRVLDPVDRVSEILFGLIMALSFTCSISVAEADEAEVRTMLIGALGCNLAWGIIDGTIFVVMNLIARARNLTLIKAVRAAADQTVAFRLIADALPPLLAPAMDGTTLEALRRHLLALREDDLRGGTRRDDWLGALALFLLVVLATFPVALPFVFIENVERALRVSNGIAIVMLFACGWILGRYAGRRPWSIGIVMAAIGVVLVAITIALGG